MANRPAPPLVLPDGVREELERRARIVLLAADGVGNTRIVELTSVTANTVLSWRDRYAERGLQGLGDLPRPGRPRELDHRAIVAETLRPPPKKLWVTH